MLLFPGSRCEGPTGGCTSISSGLAGYSGAGPGVPAGSRERRRPVWGLAPSLRPGGLLTLQRAGFLQRWSQRSPTPPSPLPSYTDPGKDHPGLVFTLLTGWMKGINTEVCFIRRFIPTPPFVEDFWNSQTMTSWADICGLSPRHASTWTINIKPL